MTSIERNCTLILNHESNSLPKVDELRLQLESKDESVKIEALKTIILYIVNGESLTKLLMPVIKYCLYCTNHLVKKLLMIYWEVVPKKGTDGKLFPEMILVCNAMKNNLNHANEYIRGSTLRFLCNMQEPEILESLVPSVTANLKHRHSYVRKNAVLAVFTIFQSHPDLIPDAPELVEEFLHAEANLPAKRNAFLMLLNCKHEKAIAFFNTVMDSLPQTGESFQLVALELIRKACRLTPAIKSQYIRCIYSLANSNSNAVAFEGANTLVSLSTAPTALRAAIGAYTRLLSSESDSNVKLIILNKLLALKKKHERILQELLMDILRVLSSPNLDIRKRALQLALDLVAPRNVEEVMNLLKKELMKTESQESGKPDEYRKLLVEAMHKMAVRFPEVVGSVTHVLMNFLGDESAASALDVVHFLREIVEQYPQLREEVMNKLLENFDEIRSAEVYRVALWIIGEYALDGTTIDKALTTLHGAMGELPLLKAVTPAEQQATEEKKEEVKEKDSKPTHVHRKPVVLADGTYAMQSAVTQTEPTAAAKALIVEKEKLRSFIVSNGDYFVASVLANTMTKLALRHATLVGYGSQESNTQFAKAMLLLTSILRLGSSSQAVKPIDKDSEQRISLCLRTLLQPKATSDIFLAKCREVFTKMIEEQSSKLPKNQSGPEVVSQADDLITIRQLKGVNATVEFEDEEQVDMTKAMSSKNEFGTKLNRVFQLTGFADPVYAEAVLTVLEYDIVLDVLVVNQTQSVLQNLAVELSASRDLKIVERPQTFNVAPLDFIKMQINIKVSSTESGIIFGNIVYDSASGSNKTVVVLNNIYMDIMDYIGPASCSDAQFREMWSEFEWENKVAVNTDISDLNDYLQHIIKITNMNCLTPNAVLSGSAGFLSANLYARSIFGEDALLNLSIFKQADKVVGSIRIRCKAQGIALSLGDKITAGQRGSTNSAAQPSPVANGSSSGAK